MHNWGGPSQLSPNSSSTEDHSGWLGLGKQTSELQASLGCTEILSPTKTPTEPGAEAHICDPSAQDAKAGRWQVHPGHRVTISQNQNQKKACKMAQRGFAT